VGRELTKLHEEFVRGTLEELAGWAAHGIKGEIVIVVEGRSAKSEVSDQQIVAALRVELATGSSTRDAVAKTTAELGVRRGRVYDLALGIPGSVTPPS
jgi:16S rRNA (cytidine1402-2'-O)-methyltransferase